MKLTKCEIPVKQMKYGVKQALVIEAEKMHVACVHVEDEMLVEYKNKANFTSAFCSAARKIGKPHMRARVIGGEVYIFNELLIETTKTISRS